MQFQLIQNFLDLPGIIGFSLVPLNDTSNHAYSVGFPQGNGPDKNPLLLQGIQQIIKTTPTSLEFCAFQFGSYQVELHKVESGAVLLVFSEGALSSQYSKSVSELMQFIKADYLALVESIQSIHADNVTPATTFSAQRQTASVDDVVAAMNSLSQVTSRYLGTQLVANHWRTYQSQDMVWLKKFCISVDGTISVKDVDSKLSPEQLTEIRLWTQRFHQRCTRIIRDYDVLVEQTLPKEHWQLLFGG
ncbi:hypothetical protein D0962_26715 [Leptolyngbyaceae cyanobacterium CCMR0082]|uniref:Uncharacterized protein n=2 Tax=Adonisia turfae TaxID=2950184 RepID=A0A6M0SCU9_9CYAN|nr:hypothetical protein [Adonisia turfae]NEZ56562.1 hypothetical protein [Adonisia turfae CCMR0081]NEZ66309.1 hypothetical protein [Adonisia turfae CCMR0082]